jgi:hypothetical protein
MPLGEHQLADLFAIAVEHDGSAAGLMGRQPG